ncbi:MAG: retroviral-like aspartic protease family protein [Deltaproteobacteria bacterium]|nr:retroviral-like aspartic protease family protein [Deltaproteobacteria bacterium]
MIVTPFDPVGALILVEGRVVGPLGPRRLDLVLDTGAVETILALGVLDDLGYGAREAESLSSVSSIVGREYGYRIRVREFEALGYAFADFEVAAHDFPDGFGIDGLLGLSFLRRFNYEIRSKHGEIHVAPVA